MSQGRIGQRRPRDIHDRFEQHYGYGTQDRPLQHGAHGSAAHSCSGTATRPRTSLQRCAHDSAGHLQHSS
eukprot:6963085-Alexandrium_andersonii.AAC.1